MPTYEYHCPECRATYDLQQGFSAETTHTCEQCHRGTARRVLHAPRVVFKGSGFYATDSKSKSVAGSEPAPAAGAAAGASEGATSAAPATPPASEATAAS